MEEGHGLMDTLGIQNNHVVVQGKNEISLRTTKALISSSSRRIHRPANHAHSRAKLFLEHLRGSVSRDVVNNYEFQFGPIQCEATA